MNNMNSMNSIENTVNAMAIHETVRQHIIERWSETNMAAVALGIAMLAVNIAQKLGMTRAQFDHAIDDIWKATK